MAGRSWTALRSSRQTRKIAVLTFFAVQVFAVTFLQKFAFNVDFSNFGVDLSLGSVELALPIFYLSLLALVVVARVKFDPIRAVVFLIFLTFATLSIMMSQNPFSTNSILLMLALYLPYMLYVEVSEDTYKKLLNIYLNFMVVFSVIVLLQDLAQIVWSTRVWPDLDRLVNSNFLLDGYVYNQPIQYGSRFGKPQGIFFLEVSLLSQWTAIAFALELVFFQRLWRLALYAIVLLACFAGTGILLLILSAPFLLARLSRRSMAVIMAVVAIGFCVSAKIHWLDQVHHRFGEYQVNGASANHRFIEPMQVMLNLTDKPSSILEGEGPGSGQKTNSSMWWVSTKFAYEYGFATALAFLSFIGVFLFKNTTSYRISFMFFIFFNTMAGVIIPAYAILFLLLAGMFRYREGVEEPDPTRGPLLRKVTRLLRFRGPKPKDAKRKRRRFRRPRPASAMR